MLLDISPLRRHRDFRLVFAGQLVSAFGSFLTYVALPVQIYELTKSSAIVGFSGTVQLRAAGGDGALGRRVGRRDRSTQAAALVRGAASRWARSRSSSTRRSPHPSVPLLFVVAAFMSAVNGFHTPALESLTPKLVDAEDLPAVSALSSLRGTTAAIAGPALAGVCIATFGLPFTFGARRGDVRGFARRAVRDPRDAARRERAAGGLSSILEGLRYAASRPELIGTYVVDIVAMTFAMPMAVFPALAAQWGGADAAGYLYSAMSVGGLVVTLFSGWTATWNAAARRS